MHHPKSVIKQEVIGLKIAPSKPIPTKVIPSARPRFSTNQFVINADIRIVAVPIRATTINASAIIV